MPRFETDYRYEDRADKAEYVWRKYGEILTGRVLDVGADACHLRPLLPDPGKYVGVGLGGSPDIQVDLEQQALPFEDGEFDTVLCLDVLEHLEACHRVFDDLCRVSRSRVIISLPNPWYTFASMVMGRDHRPEQPIKFYGLPTEPPEDRHRWFFSLPEAEAFIRHRAARNQMEVTQIDHYMSIPRSKLSHRLRRWRLRLLSPRLADAARRINLWAVLEHRDTPAH